MKRKIKENWEAIEETERLVRGKVGDPNAGFNASTWWLGEMVVI